MTERSAGCTLLLLEPAARLELQRPRVFRHRAHHVVRRTIGNVRGDFQGHGHVGTNQSDEMRNHLLGNLPGIASDTVGVEADGAVEPFRSAAG